MTAFLWIVVILMAVALVAEIVALVGIALVRRRISRRAREIRRDVMDKVRPSVEVVKELRLATQPRLESIRANGTEIGSRLSLRIETVKAASSDAVRRLERTRLRLSDSMELVEQHRRGVYRDVVEPIQTAGQVWNGIKLALWFWSKVA